jgi:hypothetical protein
MSQSKWWADFKKAPMEPWPWWVRRHEGKILFAGLLLVILL